MPSDTVLEKLAEDLPNHWQKLGRRLNVLEARLTAIDGKYPTVSERAYQMLLHWKRRNGSSAIYEVLYNALCNPLVGRLDLAQKHCCFC